MDDDYDEFISTLQDFLLPTGLPVLPGLDVGAHFAVPAVAGEAVGAWFDALLLPSGRVALTIGQTSGGGIAGAVAAGTLNAVARSALLRDGDVAAAFGQLDGFAALSADTRGTAMTVVVLDPTSGDLDYVTAGHDVPVVVGADGRVVTLDSTVGGAVGTTTARSAARHRLGEGDLLVLGISRSLHRTGARATSDSTQLLNTARLGADAHGAAALAAGLAGGDPSEAITALVAVRRIATVQDFHGSVGPDKASVGRLRHELEAWLAARAAPSMDALSIVHAAFELVGNAIEHSPAPGRDLPTHVELHATHTSAGDIVVDVVDHGSWQVRVNDDPGRGRGLAMAVGLVDSLEVTHDAGGTCARIRHRLTRPVPIQQVSAPVLREVPSRVEVIQTDVGAVRLVGAMAHEHVDRVLAELLVASRGLTHRLDVDLTGVTFLSPAGVALLGQLTRPPLDAGAPLTLRATRHSAVAEELDRAQIPHHVVG